MVRNLVIGYGNIERQDDGVGWHVVNCLRRRLGQTPLAYDDDGMSRLGGATDSVFIRQLVPELIETIVHYDRVIFVDAHVPADMPNLVCTRIYPGDGMAVFSHHLHPAMLLGILQAVWDREPLSHLLSIRGHRFDLGWRLSAGTAALVAPATEMILAMFDLWPGSGCRRPAAKRCMPASMGQWEPNADDGLIIFSASRRLINRSNSAKPNIPIFQYSITARRKFTAQPIFCSLARTTRVTILEQRRQPW